MVTPQFNCFITAPASVPIVKPETLLIQIVGQLLSWHFIQQFHSILCVLPIQFLRFNFGFLTLPQAIIQLLVTLLRFRDQPVEFRPARLPVFQYLVPDFVLRFRHQIFEVIIGHFNLNLANLAILQLDCFIHYFLSFPFFLVLFLLRLPHCFQLNQPFPELILPAIKFMYLFSRIPLTPLPQFIAKLLEHIRSFVPHLHFIPL